MLSFDGRFKSGRSAQGLVRKTLFVNQILKIHTSLITSRAFQLLRFVFPSVDSMRYDFSFSLVHHANGA